MYSQNKTGQKEFDLQYMTYVVRGQTGSGDEDISPGMFPVVCTFINVLIKI